MPNLVGCALVPWLRRVYACDLLCVCRVTPLAPIWWHACCAPSALALLVADWLCVSKISMGGLPALSTGTTSRRCSVQLGPYVLKLPYLPVVRRIGPHLARADVNPAHVEFHLTNSQNLPLPLCSGAHSEPTSRSCFPSHLSRSGVQAVIPRVPFCP